LRVVFWICCVFGLFAPAGAIELWRLWQFTSHSAIASGAVVGHERRNFSRGPAFCPKVRFSSQSGGEVNFVDPFCGDRSYQINEQVSVYYDPAEPGHALIKRFFEIWFIPIFLTALGALCVVASLKIRRLIRSRGGAWRSPREIRS